MWDLHTKTKFGLRQYKVHVEKFRKRDGQELLPGKRLYQAQDLLDVHRRLNFATSPSHGRYFLAGADRGSLCFPNPIHTHRSKITPMSNPTSLTLRSTKNWQSSEQEVPWKRRQVFPTVCSCARNFADTSLGTWYLGKNRTSIRVHSHIESPKVVLFCRPVDRTHSKEKLSEATATKHA